MRLFNGERLREICDRHDIVVYDTSIVICASQRKTIDVLSDLENDFVECDNLVTHFDVSEETHGHTRRLTKNTCQSGFNLGRIYSQILEYLMPLARDRGIIDPNKKNPMADVRLAALVFANAYHRSKTAFVSSDRKLEGMVNDVYQESTLRSSSFPCFVNSVDVYSYVQSRGIFVPYLDEVSS